MKKVYSIFLLALLFASNIQTAKALDVPSFPACSNPSGTLKASYDEGTHGIVGDQREFTGSDKVYQIDTDTLIQCFCSENNEGIQTNWWKISSLTQGEIDLLKSQGWFFVPSGAAWGLTNDPYMAKNNAYSCSENASGGSILSSADSSSSSNPTVLGLASTGGNAYLFGFASLGVAMLTLGSILKRKNI